MISIAHSAVYLNISIKKMQFLKSISLIVLMLLAGSVSVGLFIGTDQTPDSEASTSVLSDTQIFASEPKLSTDLLNYLSDNSENTIDVLISTNNHEYDYLISMINNLHGVVTQTFKYADGLSARVPQSALTQIEKVSTVNSISLDVIRTPASSSVTDLTGTSNINSLNENPTINIASIDLLDQEFRSGQALEYNTEDFSVETLNTEQIQNLISDVEPQTYVNSYLMGAEPIWATGNFGQDSLAVIIDTGIYSNHFMLQGSVIGGIDISSDVGTVYEGYNLATNHWHGTHVAGILAGHGIFITSNTSLLARSISLYDGPLAVDPNNPNLVDIPLLGMAPEAKLYAIKVFPHTGAGVPESTIITAIEKAIDLKVNQGLDVNIISMSLGGPTLFDGRDLEDQVVDQATAAGITVVSAAGNEGPASMTVGSPGSAFTSITVGAAADPIQVRVLWDRVYNTLGIGNYLYADNSNQMADFSSRGPTSDGRAKPTVTALGVYILSAYITSTNPQSIAWASGTSMATPAVSGAVALLNTFGESLGATPSDYKDALVKGATYLNGYDIYDQGAGLINASASLQVLQHELQNIYKYNHNHNNYWSNDFTQTHYMLGFPREAVEPKGIEIKTTHNRPYTFTANNLAPGHNLDFFFDVPMLTNKIIIDVSNVNLGNNPLDVNALGLYVQSSVRTTDSYYINDASIYGDAEFIIENLQTSASGDTYYTGALTNLPIMPGYVRIVFGNEWTSFDDVSGTISITIERQQGYQLANEYYFGKLMTGQSYGYISAGFGSQGVELTLSWLRNWMFYPTSDLDMTVFLTTTDGTAFLDLSGATINSPEVVRIVNPNLLSVKILITGVTINGHAEPWILSVKYLS